MNAPDQDARRLTRTVCFGLLCLYLLLLAGHHSSIDGILVFQSAKALLFEGTLQLDPPVVWGDKQWTASPFGIGMTLAYLPLLAAASPLFLVAPGLRAVPFDPLLTHNPALYANLPYLVCSVLNPRLTALTAGIVLRLALRLRLGRGAAVAAALAFGIASPALAYARFDYTQPLAALTLTAAVFVLVPRGGLLRLLAGGAWLGAAVLTRAELVVLAGCVCVWAGRRSRSWRPALLIGAPVVLAVLAVVGINALKHGALGATGYGPTSDPFLLRGFAESVLGLIASPGRGLLI